MTFRYRMPPEAVKQSAASSNCHRHTLRRTYRPFPWSTEQTGKNVVSAEVQPLFTQHRTRICFKQNTKLVALCLPVESFFRNMLQVCSFDVLHAAMRA
jgi:hypothetical protein